MSDQKFFSGLTDGMMRKSKKNPDRQQTNFFWPDETKPSAQSPGQSKNPGMTNTNSSRQPEIPVNTQKPRKRVSPQNQSSIVFSNYDSAFEPIRHEIPSIKPEFLDFITPKFHHSNIDEETNQESSVIVHNITLTS